MLHKLFVILAVVLVVAAVATPVAAGTFTFDVTSGVWDLNTNWDPTDGPPGINDKAIIPTGKTCQIASADSEDAKEVDIQGTGVLDVDGTLSIGENATANTTVLTIGSSADFDGSGHLHLYENATINATVGLGDVTIYNDLTLSGTGEITGVVDWDSNVDEDVTIASGLKLRNIGRLGLDVINNGEIIVDNFASNVSFLGDVSGSGTYRSVNAGNMIIDPGGVLKGTTGTWQLEGGLLDFRGTTSGFADTMNLIHGTFNLDKSFRHSGDYTIGGATQGLDIELDRPGGTSETILELGFPITP